MITARTKHPLYGLWMGMKNRCSNPNAVSWQWYGAKGIAVCDRWKDFENFLEDMAPRPPNTTLDRIESDKGYEPGNCRWATHKEQGRNKKDVIVLSIEGKDYLARELSEISGHKTDTIVNRWKLGLSYEEIIAPERLPTPQSVLNKIRAENKRRASARFCKWGHEFTEANTIRTGDNRRCRECHNAVNLRSKARKKAKRYAAT